MVSKESVIDALGLILILMLAISWIFLPEKKQKKEKDD